VNEIIAGIRAELRDLADEKTRESGRRFFKEPVKLYGVKTAAVMKLADRTFRELHNKDKTAVFPLCEELFSSGCMEESFIAARWSEKLHRQYEPDDFGIFERWVDTYVTNWASCDTFCNHTVGSFMEMFPEYARRLTAWARSENRWVRRGAAVSLIVPAKRGMFLGEAFSIADILLIDTEDLVQKGYGWLLKEESRKHQDEVLTFVLARKEKMPRTALRYAIELMPPEKRKLAMAK
jgi:3-methyladenine DNA glycosylase AlkD